MRRRHVLLQIPTPFLILGAFALLAPGCGPRPRLETPHGWSRTDLADLAATAPRLELDAFGASAAFRAGIGYLGSEEPRDMSKVPKAQLAVFPFRRPGEIRTIAQAAGTRLAWSVELGSDPYVSFIPLGWTGRRCPCRYRFGLRDARGQIHELWREEAARLTRTAPGTVAVDLTDYAESRVDLLFEVDAVPGPGGVSIAAPPPEVAWGSPTLYDRRPIAAWPSPDPGPPNVLIVGIDTLRADHVGALRSEPAFAPSLTPAIDRLAAESDVWTHAYSTFNSTNPSFASIFTGLYGKNHGVYDLHTPLPKARTTLAELFSEAGYQTLAVISASHLGDHNSGLGQGFGRVILSDHTFAAELPVDDVMDWIARRGEGAAGPPPFFVWLHLFDPHTPHTPPEPYALGFRPAAPSGLSPVASWIPFRRPGEREFSEPVLGGQRDLYAGEVAYVDRQVDRLLGFLGSRGLMEHTIVVLVADHGENLGDHGIDFRHIGLWETTTHVPLLVHWPGQSAGRRLAGLVQTIDLFPTLLAGAGLDVPAQDGTDLHQLTYDGHQGRRAVFAEHADHLGAMVRTATHRYFRIHGETTIPDGAYLYDLTKDPGELHNLAGRGLPVERELSNLLDRWLADRRPGPRPESQKLTDEERQQLRALGYVN
jgi:arylsulfatase A-like enzyme